jgi:hypothetical protein
MRAAQRGAEVAGAHAELDLAELEALAHDAIWADLNTASPSVKQRLAELGRQLADLGVRPIMADASRAPHERLAAERPSSER